MYCEYVHASTCCFYTLQHNQAHITHPPHNHPSSNQHTICITNAPHIGHSLATLIQHLHAFIHRNESPPVCLCIDGTQVETLVIFVKVVVITVVVIVKVVVVVVIVEV